MRKQPRHDTSSKARFLAKQRGTKRCKLTTDDRVQKFLNKMKLKRTWIITDPHFLHRKMEILCGRPKNFETRIVRHWKRLVKPTDIIICLGDVAMGDDAAAHEQYVSKLPGFKILVRGNHDKRSDHWYETHGWDFCCNQILLERFGYRILFTHRPVYSASYLDLFDLGVFGHLHNTVPKDSMPDNKHYCLALENENYQPVLLESLVDRINKLKGQKAA